MLRAKQAAALLCGSLLLPLGFAIIGFTIPDAIERAQALDDGQFDRVPVLIEGTEPVGRRSSWRWKAFPADGGAVIDSFTMAFFDDDELLPWNGKIVVAELVDGEVSAVEIPHGTTLRTGDVGLGGAVGDAAHGGTLIGLSSLLLAWFASRYKPGLGLSLKVLGSLVVTTAGIGYVYALW
ncbi:MAG TPA: hypothetical protein VNS55_01005 [Nocardioides sp.]|nr:hypothetical protein [Nocardioides sp.]